MELLEIRIQVRPCGLKGNREPRHSLAREEETSMKLAIHHVGLLLILSATVAAAGQQRKIDPAKEADIRELLRLTGMTDVVGKQMGQMADQAKPLLERSLPPGERRHEIVEDFTKRFLARANSQGLIAQVIPVYDKYLTDDDVKAVIRFYKSPVGQRLLKIMPEMMKEASAAGQQWGEQIAHDVLQEMAQEYPELKQQP
jgi:uncharacterized protein